MLYQDLLSIVLYLGMTCQPLVIIYDSASVSTIDKAINSTSISQHSSQWHYKYLVINYVQQYINPPVASWIEPTCPLSSHPVLHLCDHLSTITLYKGFQCACSPQQPNIQRMIYLCVRLGSWTQAVHLYLFKYLSSLTQQGVIHYSHLLVLALIQSGTPTFT